MSADSTGKTGNARQAYQARYQADRIAARATREETQREHLRLQQVAAYAHARSTTAPVPLETINWHGLAFSVINRRDAHRLLSGLRDSDRNPIYPAIPDDINFFPAPSSGQAPAVFLLAEAPISVAQLNLCSRIPEHPELLILGLICLRGLEAAQYIDVSANGGDPVPSLIVLGQIRSPLLTLSNSKHIDMCRQKTEHYFGGGLDCELLATPLSSYCLHIFGPTSIHCLVSGNGNILFDQTPRITFHAAGNGNLSRVIVPYHSTFIFLPPSHYLTQLFHTIPPDAGNGLPTGDDLPWNREAQLKQWQLAAARSTPLLRPDQETLNAYASFPERLQAAFECIFAAPHTPGPKSRYGDYCGSELTEEFIDGKPVLCQQLIRQRNFTITVLMRAVKRLDTGEISLHLEHLTSPRRSAYRLTGTPDDNTLEVCIVKYGILETIARLEKRYLRKPPER